jgi:3-oxoadipate enol-lactonase
MGSTPEETLAAVRASSPQLYETVVDGAFGGPLARPELTRRDREMATVAVLAALGAADPQLRTHATAALGNDVAPSELLALCEHVAVYAGFPRALNALHQIDQRSATPAYHRRHCCTTFSSEITRPWSLN